MAACTLALSPSSAKVAVCKRTFLRASSHGPTLAQRITGAASATESAGVAAAKGLTGKGKAWGKEAMKAIPCARQLGVNGTIRVPAQAHPGIFAGMGGRLLCRGHGSSNMGECALQLSHATPARTELIGQGPGEYRRAPTFVLVGGLLGSKAWCAAI